MKKFIIIGDQNAITYKEVFPLLKDDEIWLGPGFAGGNAYFYVAPEEVREFASGVYDEAAGLVKFRNVCWSTNMDHGRRHEPLELMTMADCLKYNKRLRKLTIGRDGIPAYRRYENLDAIEVPFVDCIPLDWDGLMGVPITFLDRYAPDQFEIVGQGRNMDLPTKTGMSEAFLNDYFAQGGTGSMKPGHPDLCYYDPDGTAVVPYRRIVIRHRR